MIFDWSKYLDLASCITGEPAADAEASYRTAISRAYYAAFCTARDYVSKKNNTSYNSDAHRRVRTDLEKAASQKLANQLRTIMDMRHKADYENNFSNPKPEAFKAITRAKQILEEIKSLTV